MPEALRDLQVSRVMTADKVKEGGNAWQVFDVKQLKEKVVGNEPRILEFLRVSSMSCSIYHLPAGSKDMQSPHLEDELYMVISGKAVLEISGEKHKVGPGSILFVKANTEHSFFDIEEDLTVIAFFGPLNKSVI